MELPRVRGFGWVRLICRFGALAVLLILGLGILIAVRLPEYLLVGARRPVSSYVPHVVCKIAVRWMGLRFESRDQ